MSFMRSFIILKSFKYQKFLSTYPTLKDELLAFLCNSYNDMFWYNNKKIPPVKLFLTIHGNKVSNIINNFNSIEKQILGKFFGFIFVTFTKDGYVKLEPPITINYYGIKTASCFEKHIDE